MTDQNQIRNQFRENELAIIKHFDKQRQEYVSNVYPKVGGRLRLAHEANDAINIETEIYRYDENLAVVIATVKTMSGQFTGIGMSSLERDKKIAPAILELAETRGIARALRFAGYGVEYCSAEEISHLENGNPAPQDNKQANRSAPSQGNGGNGGGRNSYGGYKSPEPGNGNNGGNGNGNGYRKPENGGGRLSPKQYKFLINLSDDKNISYEDLNQKALNTFGVALEHLSKNDASSMIQELQSQ